MMIITTALATALLAIAGVASAQTVYFQGSQQPGVLAPPYAGTAVTNSSGVASIKGSTSCRLEHTGGAPNTSATSANTDQTPVATEFYYAEIKISAPCTATGAAVYNGSVASGNLKVGLADVNGAIVATSASTAASGTTQYQRVAFTATYNLVPGTYYILAFYDNNTQRSTAWTAGSFGAGKVTGQVFATGFTAFTPATTFTTALGPVASLY